MKIIDGNLNRVTEHASISERLIMRMLEDDAGNLIYE